MSAPTTLSTSDHSAVAGPGGSGPWRGTSVPMQIIILTGRSLRAVVASRALVLLGLLQPLIMLILFSQVFASLAGTSSFPAGVSYIDYLMPAVLVMGSLSVALQSGVGLLDDMRNGVVARFRTLPIASASVLVARSLADVVRHALQLAIMLVLAATLFGFSPGGGFTGVLLAWLMCIAVGWSLSWMFMAIGVWISNVEVMQGVTSMVMFPLMFASSAYVPLSSLPAWLRAVATVNPLTYSVDASRNLALGNPVGIGGLAALGAAGLIGITGAIVATRGFRRSA
ncbi:ABC transporter permease [Amycolatopsis sp. NPDC048633]|uniref:ABC transporter permease n=1 Tax=Amycolatopsis sp. NPDC048633 TaxID=3157095 RepID=UPI0033ED7A2A